MRVMYLEIKTINNHEKERTRTFRVVSLWYSVPISKPQTVANNNIVRIVYSTGIMVIAIKEGMAKFSEIVLVSGIRAADETRRQGLFARGGSIVIIWRISAAILIGNVGDESVVLNSDADFIHNLDVIGKKFMVALQRHVTFLSERIEHFFNFA